MGVGTEGPMGTVTSVPGLTHFMSLAGRIILGFWHLARPAGCVVAMNVRVPGTVPGAGATGAGATGAGAGVGTPLGAAGFATRVPGLTQGMPLPGLIILGSLHLSSPAGWVVAMKPSTHLTPFHTLFLPAHMAGPSMHLVPLNTLPALHVPGAPTGAGVGAGAGLPTVAGAAGPMGTVTRVPGLTHFMSLAGRIILGSWHLARPAGCVVAMNVRDVRTRQGLDGSRS